MDFPWRLKWVIKLISRSPFSYMTDRQRLTWQQTFLKESAKLVYGPPVLLPPEWTAVKRALCRWCSHRTHGMRVRGPHVAGWLVDENVSGLWVVEFVEELELITCEKRVVDQSVRLLIRGSAQGISLSEPTHIEKGRDQEDEVEDERDCEKCKVKSRREIKHTSAWHMDDMTRTTPWANVTCDTVQKTCKH